MEDFNERIRQAYYEGYEDACDNFAEEIEADKWDTREASWKASNAKKNLQVTEGGMK